MATAMLDNELNTAIDDVARQMTEGSPAAGLRHRVIARIESGDAPRRSWRAAFVLSPIAAAAAIVIALVVARGRAPLPIAPASGPTATVRLLPLPLRGGTREPDTTEPTAVVMRPAAPQPTLAVASPEPAPPLDANNVASIAVAPLAVDTLSPDPIPIEQLDAIPRMSVAPLDITDLQRRDR